MKKQNRRSKQTSVTDSSSSSSPSVVDNKQDYAKRVHDLELENNAYKRQIEELKYKVANVTYTSDDGVHEPKENYFRKLNALEEQVVDLKKKLNAPSQLSTQKHKNGEAAKQFQDEIQRLKAQKVQLQCKIKLESVQFRLCKASLEKEVLQLKKEQRRNKYEMHKLLILNRMQKLVMQRKTKEASVATKRLQDLLESRKALFRRKAGRRSGKSPRIQDYQRELEVTVQVQEVCSEYERQMEEMVEEVNNLKLEAEMVEEENSRCLVQDKEADSRVKDSELRDLNEEVARLGSLVSQMGMPKPQLIHRAKSQVDVVQSSVSVGSTINLLDMDTSESEHFVGTIGATGRPASGVCCSCSKKSLCKTTKCGCRAAGGSCGTTCGCSVSKCTNRKILIKSEDSPQSEMAENVMNSSGMEREKSNVLAPEGEVLLQNALDDKPAKMIDNCGPRKPLCDIGNTLVNSNAVRPGQKKRGRKPVIQLGTVDLPSSLPENTGGWKKADKNAMQADIPIKLPRAMRSTVSSNNP